MPFPKWPINLQYTVDLERNDETDKYTNESREYNDGLKNWGKEIQIYNGSKVTFFSDFEKTNLIYIDHKGDFNF